MPLSSNAGNEMIFEGDVLIFDLDGTLVKSSAFDGDLYQQALREVLGHSDFDTDWETYEHVTDTGLLHELLSNLGVDEHASVTRQVRDLFGEKIRNYLDGGGSCAPIPGAIESLKQLRSSGFKVGIATGGWGHTARMKLHHAGFDEPTFLSSCDDAMDRPGIMVHCREKLGGDARRVVYFGDASWDLKATKALGWRFVGVGEHFSGLCSEWISDFHDPRWPLSPDNAPRRRPKCGDRWA